MTATKRLRKLLDERGVKWMPIAWNPNKETFYHAANGIGICIDEYKDGVKFYTDATVTPEQAVAATLGRGECRNVHEPPADDTFWPAPHFKCSECGCVHVSMDYVYYCPNCGRKVVED